jgi:hypothetical protein
MTLIAPPTGAVAGKGPTIVPEVALPDEAATVVEEFPAAGDAVEFTDDGAAVHEVAGAESPKSAAKSVDPWAEQNARRVSSRSTTRFLKANPNEAPLKSRWAIRRRCSDRKPNDGMAETPEDHEP